VTTPPDKIRCRHCGVTFLKWRRTKDGKNVSGWPRLKDHIHEYHPDEAEAMEAALGPEEDE